ncbi:MAG: hypothetical protein CL868_10260 [Cytophagaceae bacterium]|nr:hypothetical protein [Cytophagaceae bacterium]|tara:strand:+ start:606 stop:1802 length:1197 start_codon:yes stop_codon:yes gene_type:complete
MDYVFSPTWDPYNTQARDFFRERDNTELIVTRQVSAGSSSRRRVHRIDQLITCLKTDTDIQRPVGNIYIVSHGRDNGWMQVPFANIDLDSRQGPDNTTYEVLIEADNSNVCDIPAAMRDDNTKIRIRGCNIGQDYALPFVNKLKAAFGGNVPISAPKHYVLVVPIPDAGSIEAFCYQFQLKVRDEFTGDDARQNLIEAFQLEAHDFVKGAILTDDWWDKWIPEDISVGERDVLHKVRFSPPLKPRRGADISVANISVPKAFKSQQVLFPMKKENVTSDPGSPQARLDLILDEIRNHPLFASTHAYPYYKRMEFDTVNDFLDAHLWFPIYKPEEQEVFAVGRRYIYTVSPPITLDPEADDTLDDGTKNKLLYNFTPKSNNPNPAVTLIDEDDTEIFQIV